jgi:cytochrome b561
VERIRYTLAQRLLHWLIALMVFAVLAVGLTFMALDYEGTVQTLGRQGTDILYKYHKTFGILLLLLTFLRIALRWRYPAPPYRPPLTGFERVAAGGVHLLLYLLLIAMPIGGWLATAAGGYPVQFFELNLPGLIGKDKALSEALFGLHGAAGLSLLFLILLHVGAAIKHLLKKDRVMHRISLP